MGIVLVVGRSFVALLRIAAELQPVIAAEKESQIFYFKYIRIVI